MKKKVGWVIVILLLSINAFSQTGKMHVKIEKENVRAEPKGKKLGELLGGAKVSVLEKQSNWTKIQFTGWIWSESLTSDSTEVHGFTVRASHILVNTEKEANDLLARLKRGENFEELARLYSIDKASGSRGGDLGEFGRGDFRPEFENSVFRLKIGELSGIVKTELGYHIIKRIK